MERNVGGLDRTARIVIGIIAAVAGILALAGFWQVGALIGAVALIVGAILLVTGTARKCPINQVAGITTAER